MALGLIIPEERLQIYLHGADQISFQPAALQGSETGLIEDAELQRLSCHSPRESLISPHLHPASMALSRAAVSSVQTSAARGHLMPG